MQHLPNEILEFIFVHLSIEDLLLSVALVCTTWRDLVQNVHVLPWKKACHRFIRRLPPENHSSTHLEAFLDVINNPMSIKQYTFANEEVNSDVVVNKTIHTLFMDPNQVLHLELALPWLVTYLSARFTLSHHETLQLQRHSKYSLVKAVIFERFPEWWDEREDVAKGVPAAVLLSVIAYRPQHVREIIDHLLKTSLTKNSENLDGPSNSPVVVLELMHAIAFGLSFFLERSDGNPVFSYNVLTALNEYEQNRDVVIPDALQLLKSPLSEQFVLGPDQARVVNHVFSSSSDVVAVEGFPGTGKTLAVANMCQVNQDRKFLVLCYSHSVRNHLLKMYPSKNVVIQSLIEFVASCGHAFSNDKIVTSFGPNDVFLCDVLDCFGESREVVSMAVYKTILFFVYSELTDLSMEAVEKGCVDLNLWTSWYGQILSAARKIWSAIIDPEYMKLGIPLVALMKILKNDPNATDLKQTTLIVENLCDLTPHIFQYFKAQFNHVVLMNEKIECINHRGEHIPICFTHTYRLVQNHRNGHHIGSLLDQVFRMKPRQQKAMKIGSRTDDEVSSFLDLRNSKDGETVIVISETEEDLVDFLLSLDLELNSEYFGTFLHPLSKRFFDKYEAISSQLAKHAIISKFEDCIEGSYLLEDDSFLHSLSFHDSWYRKGFLSDLPHITDRLNPKPCPNGSPYFILTTLDNIRGMEFDRVLFYRHSPQNFFRKIPPKPRVNMPIRSRQHQGRVMVDSLTRAVNSIILSTEVQFTNYYQSEIVLGANSIVPGASCATCNKSFRPHALHLKYTDRDDKYVKSLRTRHILCALCSSGFVASFGIYHSKPIMSFVRFLLGPLAHELPDLAEKLKAQYREF